MITNIILILGFFLLFIMGFLYMCFIYNFKRKIVEVNKNYFQEKELKNFIPKNIELFKIAKRLSFSNEDNYKLQIFEENKGLIDDIFGKSPAGLNKKNAEIRLDQNFSSNKKDKNLDLINQSKNLRNFINMY